MSSVATVRVGSVNLLERVVELRPQHTDDDPDANERSAEHDRTEGSEGWRGGGDGASSGEVLGVGGEDLAGGVHDNDGANDGERAANQVSVNFGVLGNRVDAVLVGGHVSCNAFSVGEGSHLPHSDWGAKGQEAGEEKGRFEPLHFFGEDTDQAQEGDQEDSDGAREHVFVEWVRWVGGGISAPQDEGGGKAEGEADQRGEDGGLVCWGPGDGAEWSRKWDAVLGSGCDGEQNVSGKEQEDHADEKDLEIIFHFTCGGGGIGRDDAGVRAEAKSGHGGWPGKSVVERLGFVGASIGCAQPVGFFPLNSDSVQVGD